MSCGPVGVGPQRSGGSAPQQTRTMRNQASLCGIVSIDQSFQPVGIVVDVIIRDDKEGVWG